MTQYQPEYDPRQQPPQTPPQWGGRPQDGAWGGQPQYPPRQPQYPPQGYRPQPQYPPQGYGPQYPPPQQPPRKSRKGLAFLGCGGLVVLVIIIAAVASSSSSSSPSRSSSPPPAASQQQPAAPAQPPAKAAAAPVPLKAKTVATFSGSGVQSTPPFTVTSTWRLDYKFDCSSFGYKGNFIVMEDGGLTGAMDVNALAMTKSGTSYAYNDAGQHYIKVDSECAWTLKVIDEG
jgi:hypothetical protein